MVDFNTTLNKSITKPQLKTGDILKISRTFYDHYGIYSGCGTVIHYADKSGDFGEDICVQEIPIEHFSKGATIQVCNLKKSKKHHLYSPKETVARARSRIGESEYNLVCNNCEHFALWCKTGISESSQVQAVLKAAAYTGIAIATFQLLKNIFDDE